MASSPTSSSSLCLFLLLVLSSFALASALDMSIIDHDLGEKERRYQMFKNPQNDQCDNYYSCPSGSTCCCFFFQFSNDCLKWECCPFESATCCDDYQSCCPPDFPVCDTDAGTCLVRKDLPFGIKAFRRSPALSVPGQQGSSATINFA